MKVICIQESKERRSQLTGDLLPLHDLVVGGYYTVVNVLYLGNKCFYELEEHPPCPRVQVFGSHLFALVSDIDEASLVNEKEEVYA